MLSEAKKNCELANATNVTLLQSGNLSGISGQYCLVHSYIVLQHISWRRGRKIIQALSEMVAPGGYLVVQVYSDCLATKLVRSLVNLRYFFPPANWLRNALWGRPLFEPPMQLHAYDLNAITRDLKVRKFAPH